MRRSLIKFSVCQSFSFCNTLLLDGTLFNHQFRRCFLSLLQFFLRPCPISSDLPAKYQSDCNFGVLSLPLHSITKCRNPFFLIWNLEIFICLSIEISQRKWKKKSEMILSNWSIPGGTLCGYFLGNKMEQQKSSLKSIHRFW